MKILIHALGVDMGGALRHLTNFIPELGQASPHIQYVVLVRDSVPSINTPANVRIEQVPTASLFYRSSRLVFDILQIPIRLKRDGFAAVVSLVNGGPIWSPVPHILFQRNALLYWKPMERLIPRMKRAEIFLRRKLAVLSMMRADLIVTPSRAMADMIRQTCPRTQSRAFTVLYHGCSVGAMGEPLDSRFLQDLAQAKGVRLLYPTHPAPHKGFEILFDTLAILRDQGIDCSLVATTERSDWPQGIAAYEKRLQVLNVFDKVVFLGRIPQSQMGKIYQECDILVFPSLCESFGFALLEGMAHGIPIVAARTAVSEEVCGDCALYYSPLDPREAATRIQEAMDPVTRSVLVRRSHQRMQQFDWSWQRYAREFVGLIESVV